MLFTKGTVMIKMMKNTTLYYKHLSEDHIHNCEQCIYFNHLNYNRISSKIQRNPTILHEIFLKLNKLV